MVRDQFGNYVVQKILDHTPSDLRVQIVERIMRIPDLRRISYGKHIIARIEKQSMRQQQQQQQQQHHQQQHQQMR